MKSLLGLVSLIMVATTCAWAQDHDGLQERKSLMMNELARKKDFFTKMAMPGDVRYDVTYYQLAIAITATPNPNYVRGTVVMKAFALQDSLSVINMDLKNNMIVDSVRVGGVSCAFTRYSLNFDITLDHTYNNGDLLTVEVFYRGVPGSSGLGSFTFSTHGSKPWVYTLSEPYGAKDWWPCKDHPSDKADSMDIYITCDSTLKAGSNGVLVSTVNNGNGTKTFHWKERYPITTYLVAVTLSNFVEFTHWFHYTATDSMPILNYVFSEHLANAQTQLARVPTMLSIFSNLFGLYPFVDEKYGHVEFGWGGAMEHQTMTSTITFSEYIIAHELGHQWFGDMITCANWHNIWMNEGFATYSEALYGEARYGKPTYWSIMNGNMSSAKNAVGSIFVQDTTDVNGLFDGALVYDKGSVVLHMLRHVLGDSVFFDAMYAYANDPRYQHGAATTEDFQGVCEAVSGQDLDYFFTEWIYGEKYPRYQYWWSKQAGATGGYDVTLGVTQTTQTNNPVFYTMPIDYKLKATGWDTTITVFNDQQTQTFTYNVSHQPTTVLSDSSSWILRTAQQIAPPVGIEDGVRAGRFALNQNHPNPFNPTTTITYQIPGAHRVSLVIYNALGQKVRVLVSDQEQQGDQTVVWDGRDDLGRELAGGVYVYRLTAGSFTESRKAVLLK